LTPASFPINGILLVDKEEKNKNDRTWCFWETRAGLFENCVYKRWDKMWFHDKDFSKLLDILPYQYKMIRGIDFYKHCFAVIGNQKNIDIVYGNVKGVTTEEGKAVLFINDEKITGNYIFNSILFEKPVLKKKEHYLLQHFKGWDH
jgi:lycopene beta-cyclase